MKKMLLIALLAVSAMAAHSQGRSTTVKEYNYLIAGKFSANMPAHHLVKSSVYVTDKDESVSIWQLYRDGSSVNCALVIIYTKGKAETDICVPDVKSPDSMWKDYNKRLGALKNMGTALQIISLALGKFTASE